MIEPEHVHVELSARQLKRWGRRIFDTFFCSASASVLPFGKESIWHVHTAGLQPSSIVVSAGVGNDVSFEKELVAFCGCRILLLDPSPTGAATMARRENQLPQIEFLPIGLAGSDGEHSFTPPADPVEGSFTVGKNAGGPSLSFACRSLSSLLAERQWSHIDLLKIDIEGFECQVLDEMLASGIRVRQICVEFHHFMDGIPLARTITTLRALHHAAFRLAHKSGSDYTLLNTLFSP